MTAARAHAMPRTPAPLQAVTRPQTTKIVGHEDVRNGGSRATAVTSDHHAARLAFQSMSDPNE
jgi:hypothetical protein